MEVSNEANAVNILSWIFDELDTQRFGLKNNKHFNYFDDSEENIEKINHFYLNLKTILDINLNDKGRIDGDAEDFGISGGRQSNNNNGSKKNPPNQGETGSFEELNKSRYRLKREREVEKVKVKEEENKEENYKIEDISILSKKDSFKSKNLNFECFDANISLNPEENKLLFNNAKELRKYKSEGQINLKDPDSSSINKKLNRSFSTSALISPISVHHNVKYTSFIKDKSNSFFSSSNRSLFNSTVLTDESDILTDEFPDNKLEKNEVIEEEIIEENLSENKEEIINNNKINNSIRNTDIILEKIMDNSTNPNHEYFIDTSDEKLKKENDDIPSLPLESTTAVNTNVANSKEDIIKISLESVMTEKNMNNSKDDLFLIEKNKMENKSAYTLNEYGQSLFRLRYYLLQLKYLIDCDKDLEQIVFYKLALSQYPDSNSIRTWLKRRITREPLVHGYCLPPFTMNDESHTNDMFKRPLKNKIFHSLSLDKKYQVIEPLSYEFNRKVMGTSEHKSLVNCNSNLKYCQMKQRSDIVLRTIFIKRLFQQAPAVKRAIGVERFQTLKDKALLNLQPRASKHYKPKENISNSMISIKLKTNKKKGIYLQHHSKKSSIDFTSRNARLTNNALLPPQPVDTINNGKGLYSSAYNKIFEKSKSFQNIFSSNSPSKLRNCHMLEPTPTHKYSYSQPLTHIIFNKQNNQYSIEPLPPNSTSQRFFNKEKTFFSKYIFSNTNYGNINNYKFQNATTSNGNLMINNSNNNINNNNNNANNNNNNVIIVTSVNGMTTNITNNPNINVPKNNRNMVKSEVALNAINNNKPSANGCVSKSNNNINNNLNPYNYGRKTHCHISSISSIKDINKDMNTCYNLSNLKNSLENTSKAKLNNCIRNFNTGSTPLERSRNDITFKHRTTASYDFTNSNRKLRDIQSQKSLHSFNNSDRDSIQERFNQFDVINNYSDQDSVYSLSSLYDFDKNKSSDNSSSSENVDKNPETPEDDILNSNKTLVVYQKNNKTAIFKKIFGIMKPKKHADKKSKKSTKNNLKQLSKNISKSNNIVDSDETINNSVNNSNLSMNSNNSYPNTSVSNSNFSMNSNSSYQNTSVSDSNFSMNKSNYNSNETIHPNNKSINNKNTNIINEKGVNKSKNHKKWHINIFKSSNKTRVKT